MACADDVPEERLDEDETGHTPDIDAVAPPVHREPVWLLVLGVILFLGLLALNWYEKFQQPPNATYLSSTEARLQTYLVQAVLYWDLRGEVPKSLAPLTRVNQLATMTAQRWEEISESATDPRMRGLTAVNAAALYGAADHPRNARRMLDTAARRDRARAGAYRALLPLYADTPAPVVLPPQTGELLSQLSSGPIIRARNAQVGGDTATAITALRPGATAGIRVLVVNAMTGGFMLLLLIGAIVLFAAKYRRITDVVREVTHAGPADVPWGIGASLLLISATYFAASPLALLLSQLVRWGNPDGAQAIISAIAIPISALIVVGLFLVAQGRKPWQWGVLGWWRTHRGVRFGLGALVLAYPLVILATLLSTLIFREQTETHQLVPIIENTRNVWALIFWFLIAAVMAPLVEETLFRGVLFRALNDRLPFWGAAVLSGLLFAIIHAQLVAILPITILGITFALLTRASGSLLAPAAAHAGFNAFSMINVLLLTWALHGPGA